MGVPSKCFSKLYFARRVSNFFMRSSKCLMYVANENGISIYKYVNSINGTA